MHSRTTVALTTGAALGLLVAGLSVSPAAPNNVHKPVPRSSGKPLSGAAAVSHGKALVNQYKCNTCHGADLAGKPHFAPSLHATGVLKEYNQKTWERVLDTGLDNDGKPVRKPMPVYHMKAADADAIYAYCKTLK